MPNNRAAMAGRWSVGATLTSVDFTTQTVGGMSTLPSNLLCSRSGTGHTVQTSDTTVTSGIGADVGRIGQRTSSSTTRGLVIEETRDNYQCASEEVTAWSSASLQATRTDNATTGPDGASTADQVAWYGTAGYNGCYPSENVAGSNAVPYQMSIWVKHTSGAGDSMRFQSPHNGTGTIDTTPSTSWTRYTGVGTTGGAGQLYLAVKANGALLPNVYLYGAQCEQGDFATEYHPNANKNPSPAKSTRAGERIYTSTPSDWIRNGRLGLYLKLQPKGSSTQYAANMRLWTVDASNYCEINYSTRIVTILLGGNTFTSNAAVSWAANDTVEFWTEAGGTAAQSVMAYRVNAGTAVLLGTSNGAQGAITATALDFCCNGTSNQLTSRINQITSYHTGSRPSWVP